jgi:hypothetical protein
MRRAGALGLALLVAACASEPALRQPLGEVPDLRGTWRGSWGGAPVTLLILEQDGVAREGGVALGPWSLSGPALPGVAGVFTFPVDGTPLSVNVRGRFGELHGGLALVLHLLTPDGDHLVLDRVRDDRLAGRGTSRVPWHPQGLVALMRVSPGGSSR